MTVHDSTKKFLTAILVSYNQHKKGLLNREGWVERMRQASDEHMEEIESVVSDAELWAELGMDETREE